MIRKLKHKFIAINMLLAALVLLVVFGFLLAQTWREQNRKVDDALNRAWQLVQADTMLPEEKIPSAAAGTAAAFHTAAAVQNTTATALTPKTPAASASADESDAADSETAEEEAETGKTAVAESSSETPDSDALTESDSQEDASSETESEADSADSDDSDDDALVEQKLHGSRFDNPAPDNKDLSFNSAATFWAKLDANGNIVDSGADGVTLTAATLKQMVQNAEETGKSKGTLAGAGVRFRLGKVNNVQYVAFADESSSMATVKSLAVNLLGVGAASMCAFFFISWFLAGWALKPVQKAWDDQRRFVADASHELKTPLTVILANTDILQAHGEDTIASQQKWLKSTRDEGGRMKKLIDDLLYLAKSDAAQQKPNLSRVNLSELMEGAILSFESVAFEAGVTVEQELMPGLAVMGDEGGLRRLTTILLDNACKYAAGEKKVKVALRRERDAVLLTVANTGSPIPPEMLPHLFERFYRADESRARSGKKVGGYGLGLAIAKTITENMRGTITAQSDAAGTRFIVRMPLA